jgi:uroporphyrinogen-III synthase
MIPKVVPPLTGLGVLVTRPAAQAESLCEHIERCGGRAIRFPTIAIERIEAVAADPCDLAVFVSVNAVQHGGHLLAADDNMKIAAIGKATAAALKEMNVRVDYVPESGFTSEALLTHPELKLAEGMRVLIVRGEGGRELLQTSFEARGLSVQIREVYKRVRPPVDTAARDALETEWSEGSVDVVTVTSVTTLDHLLEMLTERGRALLQATSLLVVSGRIAEAARTANLRGDIVVVAGADDGSIVDALSRWHARARD